MNIFDIDVDIGDVIVVSKINEILLIIDIKKAPTGWASTHNLSIFNITKNKKETQATYPLGWCITKIKDKEFKLIKCRINNDI